MSEGIIHNFMKRIYTLLVLVSIILNSYAYDVCIDDIYYNLYPERKEAEVTFKDYEYDSYSGSVVIPEFILNDGTKYTVSSVGDNAFYWCTGLSSITIPATITNIDSYAFPGCPSLIC